MNESSFLLPKNLDISVGRAPFCSDNFTLFFGAAFFSLVIFQNSFFPMSHVIQHPRLALVLDNLPVTDVAQLVLQYEDTVDSLNYPVDGVVNTGRFRTSFEEGNQHNFRSALSPALQQSFNQACDIARERFPKPAPYFDYVPASFAQLDYRTILRLQEQKSGRRVFESPHMLPRTSGDLCGTPQLESIGPLQWSIRVDSIVHPEVWLQLYVRFDPQLRDYCLMGRVEGRLASGNSRPQATITQGLVHITDTVNPQCHAEFQLPMDLTRYEERLLKPRKSKLFAAVATAQ